MSTNHTVLSVLSVLMLCFGCSEKGQPLIQAVPGEDDSDSGELPGDETTPPTPDDDLDGDGFGQAEDCDDEDPKITTPSAFWEGDLDWTLDTEPLCESGEALRIIGALSIIETEAVELAALSCLCVVDDDITIYVNGSAGFSDSNHQQDNHPPTEFEASVGDTIRIVAEDYNYCMRSLDPLYLHFGAGHSQDLNEAVCQSACSDDSCYDSDFVWQTGTYYDEEFTITIPQ